MQLSTRTVCNMEEKGYTRCFDFFDLIFSNIKNNNNNVHDENINFDSNNEHDSDRKKNIIRNRKCYYYLFGKGKPCSNTIPMVMNIAATLIRLIAHSQIADCTHHDGK